MYHPERWTYCRTASSPAFGWGKGEIDLLRELIESTTGKRAKGFLLDFSQVQVIHVEVLLVLIFSQIQSGCEMAAFSVVAHLSPVMTKIVFLPVCENEQGAADYLFPPK